MEFFKKNTNINFLSMRLYTGGISSLFCIASIIIIFAKGILLGLAFTGGYQIELRFEQPISVSEVRDKVQTHFTGARVQQYGNTKDILIRMTASTFFDEKNIKHQLIRLLSIDDNQAKIFRIDYVGSETGQHLANQGSLAILVAILVIMTYITLRFEYRLAISSAIALVHDVILVLGIFSLFQIEFDAPTLAAILAILGYSLNDTIVVFDRIRENFRKDMNMNTYEIINLSINQTIPRTIMTSWSTLLVVIALLCFGGPELFSFSLALFLGILIGTYSSIYVASSYALMMGSSKQKMMLKSSTYIDHLP